MNPQNLIPMNKRTPEERTKIAKLGQAASAKKKREKRMLRELLEIALSQKTETGDKYLDITAALIDQALQGNVKAYETIRDTLGQKPKEEVELSTGNTIEINITGEEK